MGRRKKVKRKPRPMPLSALDTAIYYLMIILPIVFVAGAIGCAFSLREYFALKESGVVALQTGNNALFLVPICVYLPIVIMIIGAWGLGARQPLFGNKKLKGSSNKPYLKGTPVFSQDFRKNLSHKAGKLYKKIFWSLLAGLMVFTLIAPFGMFERYVLTDDRMIKSYNTLNQPSNIESISKAQGLNIGIGVFAKKNAIDGYYIYLEFVFDDCKYKFKQGAFVDMSEIEVLRYISKLKNDFADKCELVNREHVDWLILDQGYGTIEKELVYSIFDYDG